MNCIEHAFSSRYDLSRPSLISVGLPNDFILPRSFHLNTPEDASQHAGKKVAQSCKQYSSPFYLIHGLLNSRSTFNFIRVIAKNRISNKLYYSSRYCALLLFDLYSNTPNILPVREQEKVICKGRRLGQAGAHSSELLETKTKR